MRSLISLLFTLYTVLPLQAGERIAPIPGPAIISTVETAESQAETGKRPTYHQPQKAKIDPSSGQTLPWSPQNGENLVLIGNSLAERMLYYNHFESLLHSAFPEQELTVRNLGFPAQTPAFRPFSGRSNPLAFPGGRQFRPEIKRHLGKGHYPSPDEWLTILQTDTILAFFGSNESFAGPAGLDLYRSELSAFIDHILAHSYHRETAPRLILATPIASPDPALNENLQLYASLILQVGDEKGVPVLDLHTPTLKWQSGYLNPLHLNGEGYQRLAPLLLQLLTGDPSVPEVSQALRTAVAEKNRLWVNDYRMPNGVHAYGERWNPYGNVNYPAEIEKNRQLTVLADQRVHAIAQDLPLPLATETRPLAKVETNYRPSRKNGTLSYLDEEASLAAMTVAEGYQVHTFATEEDFPNLANPCQMRFDNRGRLWVATLPSYPHSVPGGPPPNDKILIYEDTNGDGRADQETVWADQLSMPIGFAFKNDNSIYLAAGTRLLLLTDTDGDDRADRTDYLLDGFDTHDTHHAASTFETDASGALYLLEGRFLHSQVETPYGPQRMTDGGVWRFDPRTWRLDRVVQTDLSNPWALIHDQYGHGILNDASNGKIRWLPAYGIKMPHGMEMPHVQLFNHEYLVRPTSGSELLHSRHFPDSVQGDYLYANTIGFRGIAQLTVSSFDSVRRGKFVRELLSSSDPNFRPADLRLAPDGTLYFLDWHNTLIGHMQHSARDPNRHSQFGRIYRITHKTRDPLPVPSIAEASLDVLFENLRLPELRTRKWTLRELQNRNSDEVTAHALKFAEKYGKDENLLFEALRATWTQGDPDRGLLERCLAASDSRIRSGAARILRYSSFAAESPYLQQLAEDPDPSVRLQALNLASWVGGPDAARAFLTVAKNTRGEFINNALNSALYLLRPEVETALASGTIDTSEISGFDLLMQHRLRVSNKERTLLSRPFRPQYRLDSAFAKEYDYGKALYLRAGSCSTCHQADGRGLKDIYPPLAESEWITGDPTRLIKLTLHGLMGPISVNGKDYLGQVPMTAIGSMMTDEEVAAVLTYTRRSFGNEGEKITPEQVAEVRKSTSDRKSFYLSEELLNEHPFPIDR